MPPITGFHMTISFPLIAVVCVQKIIGRNNLSGEIGLVVGVEWVRFMLNVNEELVEEGHAVVGEE